MMCVPGDVPPVKVVVRMLTFIKGTTMFHVKSEPGREVLISIGRLTGQLIHSLKVSKCIWRDGHAGNKSEATFYFPLR